MNSEERSTKSGKFFFDTYAIIEIYEGDVAFAKYAGMAFFTTKLNLFELHQYFLRSGNEMFADAEIEKYAPHLQSFDVEMIKKASKFRKKHKGENLSMTDCIGYVSAKEKGLVFLTGDSMFEGLENVEFVK
ncbi:PIN domain-containing protein [Candidatus Woesearchaeota archaeon]|nr:PIN domain-containing protein [Candidatus Woesearchaeota archaeon]